MVKKTRDPKVSRELDQNFHHDSFFKIIKDGLNVEEVRIPPAFRKNMRGNKSGTVILTSPFGGSWNVQLSRRDNEIFLKDGWKKFFEDHELLENDWLLFTYSGDLTFTVKVFNMSGMETTRAPKPNTVSVSPQDHVPAAPSIEKRKRGRPRKQNNAIVAAIPCSESSTRVSISVDQEGHAAQANEEKTDNPNSEKRDAYSRKAKILSQYAESLREEERAAMVGTSNLRKGKKN